MTSPPMANDAVLAVVLVLQHVEQAAEDAEVERPGAGRSSLSSP